MPDRLSIVHAVRSGAFAGVERHIAALAAAQVADGHRVAVVGGEPAGMWAALGGLGVQVVPARTTLQVARGLQRVGHTQIVHVHMTAAEAAAMVSLAHLTTPIVGTRHFARRRGSNAVSRLAGVAIRRRLSREIAISRYVAARIEGPSTVVYSGVAEAPLVAAANRGRTVLVAQRFEPEKNTDAALRAFAASGLFEHGWILQLAGAGSQEEALRTLAGQLGISDRTEFLGMRSDVDSLLAAAGVLVAPCEVEGLGLTVLEAMASGLPVVAAGAGGHLETIGSASGAALYAPGDTLAAGRLIATLGNHPARRDAYGAELRELQRAKFTLAAQAAGTEAVYRGVL